MTKAVIAIPAIAPLGKPEGESPVQKAAKPNRQAVRRERKQKEQKAANLGVSR
jgi:hypothetical protein